MSTKRMMVLLESRSYFKRIYFAEKEVQKVGKRTISKIG